MGRYLRHGHEKKNAEGFPNPGEGEPLSQDAGRHINQDGNAGEGLRASSEKEETGKNVSHRI